MDFLSMDASAVAAGKRGDGTRYLQLFLQEYTALFNEKVNPGCPKCLSTYLNRYKNHFKNMENQCKYRLHPRYENIPLEFGSPVLVNNSNITDEYAQKLLEHKNGERYFSVIPEKKTPFVANVSKLKQVAKRAKQTKKKDALQKTVKPDTIPHKTAE
jgi:hypothetical protein